MSRTAIYAITILVLAALLVPCTGLAQETNPPVRAYPEKDPFIAGILSWLMMGTGQMYCREYTKGSIFIAADLIDKAALVLLISHINSTYAPQSGEIININFSTFDAGTQALTILYLVGSLSLRAYSVIDAMNSARKYNERIFAPRRREGLDFSLGTDRVSVEYTIRFDK